MSKSGVMDFYHPLPLHLKKQAAVEPDSECFCFKMVALQEKKQRRELPPGAPVLSCEVKQSVDLAALNINTKERGNILFISIFAPVSCLLN